MFSAQAILRLMELRQKRNERVDVGYQIDQAQQIVDNALKRSPTAAMYFSAAQVAATEKLLAQARNDAAAFAASRQRERDMYAKTRELAKPDDPLFVYILIYSARALSDQKGQAEKILRDLLAAKPDDQQARLALAEQLAMDPKTRAEALAVLDQPFSPAGMTGPKAYLVRELQIRTLVSATNLRLDQMFHSDPAERRQLQDRVQEDIGQIELRDGEGPRVLRLRGKLLRIQGKTVEAIQTLEKARDLAEKMAAASEMGSPADRIDRWEVVDMLARAYIETGQIGRAAELLTDLVNRFPTYDPGRLLLATALIKAGKLEEARPHVDYLSQRRPSDPDILKLRVQMGIMAAAPSTAPATVPPPSSVSTAPAAAVNLRDLPEDTKEQILEKIAVALRLASDAEARRLARRGEARYPGDYDMARSAVQVFRQDGDLELAKAFVDHALAPAGRPTPRADRSSGSEMIRLWLSLVAPLLSAAAPAATPPSTAPATRPATSAATAPAKQPKTVVYVCDGTDSMKGQPFDLLKGELKKAIDVLIPTRAFDVIFFQGGQAAALADGLLMANPKHKREAYDFLERFELKPGSSDPTPSLRAAFALNPEVIYLLTDGPFDDDAKVIDTLRAFQQAIPWDAPHSRVDTVGFYRPDLPKADHEQTEALLKQIALENGGTYKPVFTSDLAK
jgi:tetratricopeptide (TPR) repeat protein